MKIHERMLAGTPPFFRKLRAVGLVLAGVGGAVLAVPVELPAAVAEVGGYLVVAGGVISAVCQVTVEDGD